MRAANSPSALRSGDPDTAVLSTILVHGPISRKEIAGRLGLSQATLTRLAKPLLDARIVEETEDRLEGPGRPPRPLIGRTGPHRFVGIKLTGDKVFAVVTDVLAHELSRDSRRLSSHEPAEVAREVADAVAHLGRGGEVVAVGIAIGGSSHDGRVVDRAPFLEWRDVPLAELVEDLVKAPVFLDNDLSALAEGEHWFGKARGVPDFAVVTVGAGVGLALVRSDQVIRTRDAGLGLAGHVPLDPMGPWCRLGHRGCAEAILAMPSVVTQASTAAREELDYEAVVNRAREGDPMCLELLRSAGRGLGRLIALVANLAMVDVVVLSGDGLELLQVAEADMREQLAADRDPEAAPLDLRIDRRGFPNWARGAAAVAIERSIPLLVAEASAKSLV